ncbi:hypothetical protein K504DRAFT_460769 [Pleomassaria siparia CBS 279.74]|uniref:Uncharacterized protein n=1 Tax=Pleomassaria siparia CBS 279.74 TaxID=1314801 RepID=A0A6G1JXI9_9PLEO|nr:hypothetical protein K504DRAFT_460769 [Pleomassaria siparia CBS 279.74]
MSYMSLHQSTCLNLNGADNSDSDLWILPDFEDWEYDDASPLAHAGVQKGSVITQSSKMTMGKAEQGEWTAFMQRAASSNRERLRRRLEGDGWDFVGGKYGYGTESVEWRTGASVGEEKVDEEFDFVILLPQIAVS